MADSDQSDPFEGAAAHYARARPGYGEDAIAYLVDRFDVDESARVLDLGCGTGQLAVVLAAHAGTVVAMDPNEAMLEQGRRAATEVGRDTVEWRQGSDADLDDTLAPLRLTTMGRSFHWMNERRTLDRLQAITEPGGGVALLNDPEWLTRGQADWQAAVYDVVQAFADDLPERRDPVAIEYDQPWDELLAEVGFEDVETRTFTVERSWDVDRIADSVSSLSFVASAVRGDDAREFRRALGERLRLVDTGPYTQVAEVRVIAGTV
jgi:SAM-dependent methyltransferase